ncbi:hypothetical protein DSM106972_014550 [Dulcicalothrix desertica PCC 7102]|uniref:CHAT domain-containing protein n=1 Tax=Dulcicalothrix desertica PCC 7102 TaxID=232991 RepID=A0A3S1APZ0_9CYAN|nr:CHAT domain-containing protein [Dulcicalothrix desertica]RUT08287.1 hypothetical protein DSM106972_014550 [Dulcicalothrix desertica PCC 7102]TWH40154.1 CHAT domain-containing protein [Dulcicalothrix desertica PCC 7102]
MTSKKRKKTSNSWQKALFLLTITFLLLINNVSLSTKQISIGQFVAAQSRDASNIIQRENLARGYSQVGKLEEAIQEWAKVITYYRQAGNNKQVGRLKIEQAQVYSRLGQPRNAIELLCNPDTEKKCDSDSSIEIARSFKDEIGEIAAMGALGDAYRLAGDYKVSVSYLEQSLQKAQKLKNIGLPKSILSGVLNGLGNVHISLAQVKYRQANSVTSSGDDGTTFINDAQEEDSKAINYLQQNLEIVRTQNNVLGIVRSLQRIIPLYYRNNETAKAKTSLLEAINLLDKLPETRARVYATINLANLLQPPIDAVSRITCPAPSLQKTELLLQAVNIGQRLQDFRAESFALGELGHIYECQQDYPKAMEITRTARLAAEKSLKAQDSLYLWEWQAARILKAQGKTSEAISVYDQAVKTLESIRSDFLTANRDIQLDFRDTVEPIYRELVALRLSTEQPIQTVSKSVASKENKNKSNNFTYILRTIDSLKLAELQNYFGDDCIIVPIQTESINEIADKSSKTAFINTVVLNNKTAVILTLPGGENRYSSIPVARQEFNNKINEFRKGLEAIRDNDEFDSTLAGDIYNWLIKPFEEFLKPEEIKTLVFSQDGVLRSVPMAALYDSVSKKYLIQKYAIATIPGLNLTDIRPLNRQNLKILALGLSEDAFLKDRNAVIPGLDDVPNELNAILEKIPGKKLLNAEFTASRLEAELKKQSYPIIHIATHGEFGAEPEETYIITGEKELMSRQNKTLNFNQLEQKIRRVTRNNKQLELLTLTACKTARGDERATLGLAGVAIQAGARSALASLWSIPDAPTAEIAKVFYEKLSSNRNISKAEALQAAQIALIEGKYTHPANWAPFILIGNWL